MRNNVPLFLHSFFANSGRATGMAVGGLNREKITSSVFQSRNRARYGTILDNLRGSLRQCSVSKSGSADVPLEVRSNRGAMRDKGVR